MVRSDKAYALLGVAPGDDLDTIRKAWRKLVRAYHPDTFQGDKAAANRKLAELNAAYDLVLKSNTQGAAAEAARKAAAQRQAQEARARAAAAETEARLRRAAAAAQAKAAAEAEARAEAARRSRADAERTRTAARARAEEEQQTLKQAKAEAAQRKRALRRAALSRHLTPSERAHAARATFEAARTALQQASHGARRYA